MECLFVVGMRTGMHGVQSLESSVCTIHMFTCVHVFHMEHSTPAFGGVHAEKGSENNRERERESRGVGEVSRPTKAMSG